nr:T7SS effector LXG polymorphic toxin [Priestia taiwanensis]
MFIGSVRTQSQSMNDFCNATIQGMEQAIRSIDAFASDVILQGATYDSAKAFLMQTYRPLAQGIIYLCEELIRQNNAFPTDFQAEVASVDVIEYDILNQIKEIDRSISAMESIDEMLPGISAMLNVYYAMRRELENKLERLYNFNSASSGNYNTAIALAENIAKGLAEVQHKGFHATSGTFSVNGMNMEWASSIKEMIANKAIQEKKHITEEESEESVNQNVESSEKESLLGMTGFNWMAPIDGPGNSFGTFTGAAAVADVAYRVRNGYMVRYEFDRKNKRILVRDSYEAVKGHKKVNGRPRDYKIYYVDDIEKKIKNKTASPKLKEIDAKISASSAGKAAFLNKLGWASVAIDSYTDTSENLQNNASTDKIAGDIIGNVVVGGGTTALAAVGTVLVLPVSMPVLAVAGVGFVASLGLTYFTEGIKWDTDFDGDGEDDTIKDMVKAGAKQAWTTVAGWFD